MTDPDKPRICSGCGTNVYEDSRGHYYPMGPVDQAKDPPESVWCDETEDVEALEVPQRSDSTNPEPRLKRFVVNVIHGDRPEGDCPHGSTTGPLCHRCSAAYEALREYGAPLIRDALREITGIPLRWEDPEKAMRSMAQKAQEALDPGDPPPPPTLRTPDLHHENVPIATDDGYGPMVAEEVESMLHRAIDRLEEAEAALEDEGVNLDG